MITARFDYDDRIYYDAINDIRKTINYNRPMLLYSYNSCLCYYEYDNKYYEFCSNYNNRGIISIFVSLIIAINKINDTYNIFDFESHVGVREKKLKSYMVN